MLEECPRIASFTPGEGIWSSSAALACPGALFGLLCLAARWVVSPLELDAITGLVQFRACLSVRRRFGGLVWPESEIASQRALSLNTICWANPVVLIVGGCTKSRLCMGTLCIIYSDFNLSAPPFVGVDRASYRVQKLGFIQKKIDGY